MSAKARKKLAKGVKKRLAESASLLEADEVEQKVIKGPNKGESYEQLIDEEGAGEDEETK